MRASELPQTLPLPAGEARWLLIGNSRWHWAAPPLAADGPLRVWHTEPCGSTRSRREPGVGGALGVAPAPGVADGAGDSPGLGCAVLLGWAAVGPLPADRALPGEARLQLADVPLKGAPPWLGIDRALAGWWGWRLRAAPVLVADAGTVLSLTRVDREGQFAGGRLLAGAALQLRAMAGETAQLPSLDALAAAADPPLPSWPHDTATAMRAGVLRGLAAALGAAILEARRLEPACQLLLTGGDGDALASLLEPALEAELRPHLCLEALAALRPGDGQPSAISPVRGR